MITLPDATPDDAAAITALCAELDEFYGDAAQGTPPERVAQVLAALSGRPPMASVLLARDGDALAGFASYSFLWPAAGLTASLYLKEMYVAGHTGAASSDTSLRMACARSPLTANAHGSSGPLTQATPAPKRSMRR